MQPGKEAAIKCAALLTPAKAKIASLPLKDASDMVQAGLGKDLIDCIYGAKAFQTRWYHTRKRNLGFT